MIDFAVDRLFTHGHKGAGFFVDPGLGKTRCTLEVIRTLADLQEIDKVLVVAPLRVCKLVWPAEISKWGFGFSHTILCGCGGNIISPPNSFIDIINPESLKHLQDTASNYDLIVVDESTKFKNWTAKRTKVLRKMVPSIPRRMILTGTPTANSLADVFSQIFVLDDGEALGKNITVFRARFMHQGGWQGRQWLVRRDMASTLHEEIAPMVIRLDAESNLKMPELVINDVHSELPPNLVPEYKRLKRELLAQLESGDILAVNAASAYVKMRQFANGAIYDSERNVHHVHEEKFSCLQDLIEELNGKPLLLFFQFKHDRDRILKDFPRSLVLDGETKKREESKILESWNTGRCSLLLAHAASAGHGLNLQSGGCHDIVFYGLPDSPELYDQGLRRVYRQGVEGEHVVVHRLLLPATVDSVIRDRLDGKMKTQQEFFEGLKSHART